MNRRRQRTPKKPKPALSTAGLTKSYGEVPALEPLDCTVSRGESVALVGHNGSGKSTLLALVAGVLEPSGGELQVYGADSGSMAARAALSYLPDTPVLYDDLSVREHLEYVSRLHGGTGDEDRIDELIERLGLAGRVDQLPSQFSRGLRQKTAIAVALCRPFALMLVDEPFVGLDAEGRATFVELLGEMHAEGSAVIVATHDPDVLASFDRAMVLVDGDVVADGAPAEVTADLYSDDLP